MEEIYWRKGSPELVASVEAFFDWGMKKAEMTPAQVELVRGYILAYLALGWMESRTGCVSALQAQAARVKTPGDIHDLMGKCLEEGIDPF